MSVAVVSYVVNGGPRPVAAATRARVEQAIQELGYYPNEFARNLRRRHSSTVGLVVPSLGNAVYAEIAAGLDHACTAQGYELLLLDSHHDPKREKRLVQLLLSKQVDGVVMQPRQHPLPLIRPLQQAHVPVVLIEHDLATAHCLVLDDFRGGQLATEHLLALGHRRIGLVREGSLGDLSRLRLEGYRAALTSFGVSFDAALVIETPQISHDAGYTAMQRLLALVSPPTAVFTHNDVLALGALHAVTRAGLSVPGDISVVGYDDISSSAYLSPPLTTVRLVKHDLGLEAGRLVLDLIQSGPRPCKTVTLPVELIVRGSSASPR